MRLKLLFGKNLKPIKMPLNEEVNGFINKLLGKENKYHGNFSRYSISSMQGGNMDKNGVLNFPNGGYIFISSDDAEFITNIMYGIANAKDEMYIFDMRYEKMEINDFIVNEKYDLVRTISPLLLSSKGKVITFKDADFIETLLEKTLKKLIKCGYDEKLIKTLNIKPFHFENAKTKMVQVGKQKNIGSNVMLYVEGNKKIRKALYEIGLGKCTGFGFGALSINNKKY